MALYPLDIKGRVCMEVDTGEDLQKAMGMYDRILKGGDKCLTDKSIG
jgi:choline kinase